MSGRVVTLVLCTGEGELLGAAPPYELVNPWWRDVEDVVAAARDRLGVDVRVLRILDMPREADFPGGGRVAYLAEVDRPPPRTRLSPWPDDPLAPEPNRLPYAEPGGHERDLAWAQQALTAQEIEPVGPPTQVRTWNLSSIWRLKTDAGRFWLKVTPAFCAAEAAVLPRLDPSVVPRVLAAAPCRVLIGDVPGTDRYDARGAELRAMVGMLAGLQAEWADRVEELESLGVPDQRPEVVLPLIHSVADRNRAALDEPTQRKVDALLSVLPEWFAELAACGIPDTLVHGDFHPGNVRGLDGVAGDRRILDWSDCGIGNPMLDLRPALAYFTSADQVEAVSIWTEEWSRRLPGCDARRAADLALPLGPLFGAVAYQRFLDHIEPDERPYHEGDPAEALRQAAALATLVTSAGRKAG